MVLVCVHCVEGCGLREARNDAPPVRNALKPADEGEGVVRVAGISAFQTTDGVLVELLMVANPERAPPPGFYFVSA